ncbi:hypothetical protein [Nocardia caishijiensis]|uniref:Uncharacterized protein n=1 Tax=Nocardia caishijiensis TaxID=184756 RepID=A0ABQ6YSZ3_9NOCA|nr:hypothetical protein [Nocardia caishijiensis]KAF0848937.1 hypothetical protein FNL39_101372 [Nocardia caishijiensis]
MTKFTAGIFAVAVATVALATPAQAATGLPLTPMVADPAAGGFAPETGSSGIYNGIMCQLHTLSADVPCMYT